MGSPLAEAYRFLRSDWHKNYRYHGGLLAFARCWRGTRQLHVIPDTASEASEVDCISFSIVPKMTALWIRFAEQAFAGHDVRIIMGDCSGGLRRPASAAASTRILPLLNYLHGEKLDLFLDKVCRAEYVLVCDDDIFWTNEIPLTWALDQLARDPEVAVASILPKKYESKLLKNEVEQPMGSCFLLRRSLWLQETLSFKFVPFPNDTGEVLYYDTGEFAQLQLVQRGYKIVYAPLEVQHHLIAFDGISKWTSKIQKRSGNILVNIATVPIRQVKALRTIFMVRGLAGILARYEPGVSNPELIPARLLQRAENICASLMSEQEIAAIRREVDEKLARLDACLASLDAVPG